MDQFIKDWWDKAWGYRRETRSHSEELAAQHWFNEGIRAAEARAKALDEHEEYE